MRSLHGLLRLISPISKIYNNGTTQLINMVDGMFRLPKLALNRPLPWKQLLQIHTVIESHSIERRSKSFPCVWILLKNKKQETYVAAIKLLKKIIKQKKLHIFIKHFRVNRNFQAAIKQYNNKLLQHNTSNNSHESIWSPNIICRF